MKQARYHLEMDGMYQFTYHSTFLTNTCNWGHELYVENHPCPNVGKVDQLTFWLSHPSDVLRENCDLIKIFILLPKLRIKTPHVYAVPPWILDWSNLSMEDLKYIEVLEDLVDDVKRVVDKRWHIEELKKIGEDIAIAWTTHKMYSNSDAIYWIKSTGDVNLFQKIERPKLVQTFFMYYSFYINWMGVNHTNLSCMFESSFCTSCDRESEIMKLCGNDEFSKGNYSLACDLYSKAIEYSPGNHFLFGNRALCFIRMGHHWQGLIDGRKAMILRSNWPKGHYRFCEALALHGELELAIEYNKKAQELCKDNPEGIKDLVQQHRKLKKDLQDMKLKKNSSRKANHDKKLAPQFTSATASNEYKNMPPNDKEAHSKGSADGTKVEHKAMSPDTIAHPPKKGKSRGKGSESEKSKVANVVRPDAKETQKEVPGSSLPMDLNTMQEMVKSLVHDGSSALLEKRFHSAQVAFSRLLDLLDPLDLKRLNLSNIDYVVLLYGHAKALLGIGQCQDLSYAENELRKIILHYKKERFNSLAFYGIGNVYFRQNKYSDSLSHYVMSQTMIKHKIVSGILSWPTTSVVIEETRPEKLQVLLENCIEDCKFPPKPDAVCRYEQCLNLTKTQIYFTDPDFKGFIRIMCCQSCKVEFHVVCWKKLKANTYADKVDKDFLKNACFTPDCKGRISYVVIFDSTGLVKCEFEDKAVRKKEPQRPVVKQKSPSQKKFKVKQESKTDIKKIIHEETNSVVSNEKNGNISQSVDYIKSDNHHKILYSEIMLEFIQENEQMFKHKIWETKEFRELLLSWRFVTQEEYDAFSFESCKSSCEEMQRILDHLYKLNNRVKTRVFLYVMNLCSAYIDIALLKWVFLLNEIGLAAAVDFNDRAQEYLLNINFTSLINPWNETYGKIMKFIITDCQTKEVLKAFNQAAPEIIRCFIWFLDDNNTKICSEDLNLVLDMYFGAMDIPYNFVKSPNEGRSTKCIKVKNRHKKKKQNLRKVVYQWPGGVSTRSQEDDSFTDENTLDLLDPFEPLIIPEYLRHQIEEFETFYEATPLGNRFQRQLDNNADSTRETLYEYFSQILEEHGPLQLDDEVLVGEYKDFPEESHKLVQEAGGLKNFLLESLRFIMVGNLIGLMKHANLFEDVLESYSLNPSAEEFRPCASKPINTPIHEIGLCSNERQTTNIASAYNSIPLVSGPSLFQNKTFNNNYLLPTYPPGFCVDNRNTPISSSEPSIIPNPGIGLQTSSTPASCGTSKVDKDELAANETCKVDKDSQDCAESLLKPDESATNSIVHQNGNKTPETHKPAIPKKKNVQTAIVSVQVDVDMSEHEVNTDPYQPFETQQGDILRMEKEHFVLKDQLKDANEKYEHMVIRYKEEMVDLETQIQNTIKENKITKKEFDWLHQDLENETKKWQQQKKEKQDKIKVLKNNIKKANDANEKSSRAIEEKQKQYNGCLEDFLQVCFPNFEKEKEQIEKNTQKCRDALEEAKNRAMAAEVKVLENRKELELFKVKTMASKAENSVNMLKMVAKSGSNSTQALSQVNYLESMLSNLKKETEKLKSQFDEKIQLLKNGTMLSTLTEIQVDNFQALPNTNVQPSQPPTPAVMPKPSTTPPPSSASGFVQVPIKSSRKTTLSTTDHLIKLNKTQAPSASITGSKPKTIKQEKKENLQFEAKPKISPMKQTVFDKIIEELKDIFPHYSSGELAVFIKDLRSKTGGTLAGMKHENIVSRVTEHILDNPAKSASAASNGQNSASRNMSSPGPSNSQSSTKQNITSSPISPQPKQPWRVVTGASKKKWQKSNDAETYCGDEPCIICHDELSLHPVHKLDCGHPFHKQCIRTWLNTQSTCPTCRDHALLPEDFPALSGRMRTA